MNRKNFDDNSFRIHNLLTELHKSMKTVEKRLNDLSITSQLSSDEQYLLIDDLVRLFGVHKNTLYRYINKGVLPYSRVGKVYIFLKRDIDIIIEQNYLDRTEYNE